MEDLTLKHALAAMAVLFFANPLNVTAYAAPAGYKTASPKYGTWCSPSGGKFVIGGNRFRYYPPGKALPSLDTTFKADGNMIDKAKGRDYYFWRRGGRLYYTRTGKPKPLAVHRC